jgi:ISXO2-like transposase domain
VDEVQALIDAESTRSQKGISFTHVFTDGWVGYDKLSEYKNFTHKTVNHINEYVNGRVHTQGIENFWSLLKRGLTGTYVAVEPFHMDAYVGEQVFRYNNRRNKLMDSGSPHGGKANVRELPDEESLEARENIETNPIQQCAKYSRNFQALYDATLEGNKGQNPLARYHLTAPVSGYLKFDIREGGRFLFL